MNARLAEATVLSRPNPTKPRPVRWSRPPRRMPSLVHPVIRALAADRGSDWWREQS